MQIRGWFEKVTALPSENSAPSPRPLTPCCSLPWWAAASQLWSACAAAASFLQTQRFLAGLWVICRWLLPWLCSAGQQRLWAACSQKTTLCSCSLVWRLCFCPHVPFKWWHKAWERLLSLQQADKCSVLWAEWNGSGFTLFKVPVLFNGLENCLVGQMYWWIFLCDRKLIFLNNLNKWVVVNLKLNIALSVKIFWSTFKSLSPPGFKLLLLKL